MKDIIRQFIYNGYATKEFEKFQKTWVFRTLSPDEHNDIVVYVNFTYSNPNTKQREYERLVLKKALISINGVKLDEQKRDHLFDNLAVSVFDVIYEEYHELEKLQNEALLHEDLIKSLAEPSFDRIKFMVMQDAHALPTEQRVKDMNDYQWLWYWYNMQKKITNDEEIEKAKRDYMCMFINPQLWKNIKEREKSEKDSPGSGYTQTADENTKVYYGNTTVDDDFDKKIAHMMKDHDENDTPIALPDSHEKGDAHESKDDFINRVKQHEQYAIQQNAKVKAQKEDLDIITPVE